MASEIEELSAMFSQLSYVLPLTCHSTSSYDFETRLQEIHSEIVQTTIKHDLELSFYKTKVNLLSQTLTSKMEDLKTLDAFKGE